MDNLEELRHFFSKGYLDYRPGLSVDCAIFGYHNDDLQLLLTKSLAVTMWCIPGGPVRKEESLEQAATRITEQRTGIENLFLKQFKAFGDPGRNNPKGALDEQKFYEVAQVSLDQDSWLRAETVAVGFYAVTDILNAKPSPDLFSSECQWFSVNNLPPLGFDNDEMVREALLTMRLHLYHFPIGKSLLQQKFTLKEIKHFYEVMSGKKLNASNFPNKLISLGLIVKLDEKRSIGAHRSPAYYKFDETTYEKALREGMVLA